MVGGKVLAPYRIHGLEWTTSTLYGEEVGGTLISLAELEAAIDGYRACFRSRRDQGERHQKLRLEYSLDEAAALEFARSSTLARHLREETLSSKSFRSPVKSALPPPLAAQPAIRACADGFCPPPDPEVDWVPLWDSQFAEAMVSPGDVNGDGWDDLAVKGDMMRLWILLIGPDGRALGRQEEPQALGTGDHYFAHALAPLGDFDADGIPDLAVGAPARENTGHGRVVLLLLKRHGAVKAVQQLSTGSLAVELHRAPGFGNALAAVGDIDRDGTVDLLADIEATFALDFSRLFEKEREPHLLPLLRLDPSGSALQATAIAAKDVIGDGSDVTFADAMAGIGDLDGDGLSEVALGFPYDDDGGEERGAAWIVFLERDGSLRAKTKLSDWSGDFDAPLFNGDHFGRALAPPGDLDGDGVPDLIVAGEKELWILLLQRDGKVKRWRAFGQRSGGFVPAEAIRSLAVLDGPENTRRLAVGGVLVGQNPKEAVLWTLKLGPGYMLTAQ